MAGLAIFELGLDVLPAVADRVRSARRACRQNCKCQNRRWQRPFQAGDLHRAASAPFVSLLSCARSEYHQPDHMWKFRPALTTWMFCLASICPVRPLMLSDMKVVPLPNE